MRASIAVAAFAATAIVLHGCEDSPLTAGKDYTMSVIAQPGLVTINPALDPPSGKATILATVLNKDSVPQQGITVYFSNNGGTLQSGANGVKTDGAGIAKDVLTVTEADPEEIVVTATSAALSESVTVTRGTGSGNLPPVAFIAAAPSDEQVAGEAVVFDGTASSDADEGDFITMYKWVITSTNPDRADVDQGWVAKANPLIFEGPAISGVSIPNATLQPFHNVQELTVTLLVTDDPTAPATFAAGDPVAYRAQQTIPYSIAAVRCDDNTAPVAVISGAPTQQIFGGAGTMQTFTVDGSLSHDAETAIDIYTFNCGNGTNPTPGLTPAQRVCAYQVDGVPRTYTVTLVVTDRGTGQIVGGSYQCAKQSTLVSIQLVVSPLAGG